MNNNNNYPVHLRESATKLKLDINDRHVRMSLLLVHQKKYDHLKNFFL
jgi:hypothetical protein